MLRNIQALSSHFSIQRGQRVAAYRSPCGEEQQIWGLTDEAVSEMKGVKAGSPDTNSSKSVTFLESAGTKDTPGQFCGVLSSPGFFVPFRLNSIRPSLIAVPSLCPLSVLSVTQSLEQGLSFRTCLHSSCNSYSRMTPCEHSFHSHGISSWFIPYLKWSSLSVSVCLTKLRQDLGPSSGFLVTSPL